jgi:hypothetical protein
MDTLADDHRQDPLEACHAVVQEAYELWLQVRCTLGWSKTSRGGGGRAACAVACGWQYEVRTDDITIICIFIDRTGAPSPGPVTPTDTLQGSMVRRMGYIVMVWRRGV